MNHRQHNPLTITKPKSTAAATAPAINTNHTTQPKKNQRPAQPPITPGGSCGCQPNP
ncbi:MAG: hypothetical protein IJ789_07340 [Bacteroidales bacterium]|nr:hypothetical protein [Bacteroidales bacterium]